MKNIAMENINELIRIFNKNKTPRNKDHHCKDEMKEQGNTNNHHPIHVLKILNVLKNNPNINQRSLSKIINISPQAISDTLKNLKIKN